MESRIVDFVRRGIWLIAAIVLCLAGTARAETDVSAKVQVVKGALSYDLAKKQSFLNVSVKNISTDVLLTPVKVVVTSVTPATVTVANADGVTADGKPYFEYGTANGNVQLAPGAKSVQKQWRFINPAAARFSYNVKVEGLSLKATLMRKSVLISAANGGVITISENESLYSQGFEMTIPPGALAADTVITISDGIIKPPAHAEGAVPVGLPLVFEPDGLTFLKPVSIKIHYTDEELIAAGISDISHAKLAYFSSATSQWVDVPIVSIDLNNKVLIAQINHFCWYKPWTWFENSNTDEDPAPREKILDYAQNVWKVPATTAEIEKVLYDGEWSSIPYANQIGGILTVFSMVKSMENGEYFNATRKGGIWLTKLGLTKLGYASISGALGMASISYELLDGFVKFADKEAFDAQLSYYAYYRNDYNMSHDEVINGSYVIHGAVGEGWLLSPKPLGTITPNLTGKFLPEHLYKIGPAVYDAQVRARELEKDSETIKQNFIKALNDARAANVPTAFFSVSPSEKGNAPFVVMLDPEGSFAKNGATITKFSWDFGDGTKIVATTPETVFHNYTGYKTYDIKLLVEDNNGLRSSYSKSVIVTAQDLTNQRPIPDFIVKLKPNNEIFVDATSSSDPDGSIIFYEWSFGDGKSATGGTAVNTYAVLGEYSITLKVTDNKLTTVQIERRIVLDPRDIDHDGDGLSENQGDCDDNNPAILSPALWYRDADGDNYGWVSVSVRACTRPSGYVADSSDCNDNNSSIRPNASEICGNNIDDNCDGLVDDDCVVQPPFVEGGYKFVTKWNSNGPEGVAVDASGNVYVADLYASLIRKFTSTGTFLTTWGSSGTGNGRFQNPTGVAVDASGNVYVADEYNHRVQKFTSTGTFLTTWGSYGTGNGRFYYPCGIAVDTSGNVYVTDHFNHRIQKFTSDGTFLTSWGSLGTGNGQFYRPWGIAVDASGNVYVGDSANYRIQKFTSTGTFLTAWGSLGTGNGQFNNPAGVAVDASGNVYVADLSNHRIQKFTSTGTFLTMWGSYGSTGDGHFQEPAYVAVDPSGNVYVADHYNNRVQKFAPVSLPSTTSLPDTGQTKCYNNSSEISCPSPGQAFHGQDATYTSNPMSYTVHNNGTVTDNVTGLMWQRQDDGSTRTWSNAVSYCDSLNFAGYSDWRLPAKKELLNIVDYSRYSPNACINPIFIGANAASYWTATASASNSSNAWGVYFQNGTVDRPDKDEFYNVRCVRGEQAPPSNYTASNGTVTDNVTGLMWQQSDDGNRRTWEQAISYCEGLPLANQTGWRLPNQKELESITDDDRSSPAIAPIFIDTKMTTQYWSSTTYASDSSIAFIVGFTYADGIAAYKSSRYNYVRCVRGGQ